MPEGISPFVYEQGEALRSLGIDVGYYSIQGRGLKSYLGAGQRLRGYLRGDEGWDVVHGHSGLGGFVATMQSLRPVVVTFHGSDLEAGFLFRAISTLAANRAEWRVFVAEHLRRRVRLLRRRRTSIVPCGVDIDRFVPIDRGAARQRLGWDRKECCVLFSSAFSNPLKNAELAREVCEELGGIRLVELKGYGRSEVPIVMNACDALLVTSYREAGPLVVKEALACNVPVVSVPVGDVRLWIEGAPNCYLARPNRQELAKALQKTLSAERRGDTRTRVAAVSNSRIAEQLIRIYDEVLSRRSEWAGARRAE